MWMAKDLAYLPSVGGSKIESDNEPYYIASDYEGTNVSSYTKTTDIYEYGFLYTWEIAKTACSDGWHLASDEEWKILETHLGMSYSELDDLGGRYSGDVGKKLKSTSGWDDNGNGDNSSGFNAHPAGYIDLTEGLTRFGRRACFWTSSPNGAHAFGRRLDFNHHYVYRTTAHPDYGQSVRCVKD